MGEYASKGLANGVGIPALVLGSLGFLNSGGLGGLGGILGGNSAGAAAIQGNAYVAALAAKDAEIGELKAEKYTDNRVDTLNLHLTNKINSVAADLATLSLNNERRISGLEGQVSCLAQATNAAIAGINNTLAGITKQVVMGEAVCPEAMPRYNAFVTPSNPTTTTPST